MTKYAPLTRHLVARKAREVQLSFSEIERLLGFSLPPSSRKYRAWWSNNPSNSVMTKAWLEAGYKSQDVDLGTERLLFVRLNHSGRDGERGHPFHGWLKGFVTVSHGADLTEPADPNWGRDGA